MKEQKLSLQYYTKVSQKLSQQTKQLILESFYWFIICLKIEKSYEICNIFNIDETSIYFDMVNNFTINQTGEKTGYIYRIGNKKNWFIIVFTCVTDKYYGRSYF